jgi:hypothetical protein
MAPCRLNVAVGVWAQCIFQRSLVTTEEPLDVLGLIGDNGDDGSRRVGQIRGTSLPLRLVLDECLRAQEGNDLACSATALAGQSF